MPGEFVELIEAVVSSDPVARKIGIAQRIDQRSVGAGRLTAGTILAQTITLGASGILSVGVGGKIQSGGATLDDDGMWLVDAANKDAVYPSDASGQDWITGPKSGTAPIPYAGVTWFNQASPSRRGILIAADGTATGAKGGMIALRATSGNQNVNSVETAWLELETSGIGTGIPGAITMHGDVVVTSNRTLSTDNIAADIGEFFTDLIAASGCDVNFSGAGSIDMGSVRMTGGYETGTLNENSAWWGYNSGALPTIEVRRIANFCVISGRIQNNRPATNNTSGHPIGTIPAAFRPTSDKYFVIPRQGQTTNGVYDSQTRVVLERAGGGNPGEIRLVTTAANEVAGNQDISFDGVAYTID
jgi:hypothetical protein